MRNIPPKTLVLIGILVTLAVVLLGIAIKLSGTPQNLIPGTTTQTPTPTVAKTASVTFSPSTLSLNPASNSGTVDIIVDTGNSPITGAQIEITYDPEVITNVEVQDPEASNSLLGTPGSYTNLFTDVTTPGKIVFARAISLSGQEANGTGSVGKISFTATPGTNPTTQLTFGPETAVTTLTTTESILNTTTPLTITLQ